MDPLLEPLLGSVRKDEPLATVFHEMDTWSPRNVDELIQGGSIQSWQQTGI